MGIVKLDVPDKDNKPCFTLFEKVSTTIIFIGITFLNVLKVYRYSLIHKPTIKGTSALNSIGETK